MEGQRGLHEGADKDAARGRAPGGQCHILFRLLHQALQGGAFGQAVAATLKKRLKLYSIPNT